MTSKTVLKYYPAKVLAHQLDIPYGTIIYAIKKGFIPDAKIMVRDKKPHYMLPKTSLVAWWNDVTNKINTGEYLTTWEASLYLGIHRMTIHWYMNNNRITPSLIIYSRKKQDIDPFAVGRYYFDKKVVDSILRDKIQQEKETKDLITSAKAAKMLGICYRFLLKCIHEGRIIPDKTMRASNGDSHNYFIFYFHKDTIAKLLKSGIF